MLLFQNSLLNRIRLGQICRHHLNIKIHITIRMMPSSAYYVINTLKVGVREKFSIEMLPNLKNYLTLIKEFLWKLKLISSFWYLEFFLEKFYALHILWRCVENIFIYIVDFYESGGSHAPGLGNSGLVTCCFGFENILGESGRNNFLFILVM